MKKLMIPLSFVVMFIAAYANAAIIDAPHNETNGISCGDCHSYSLWWQFAPSAANRGAAADAVCATCHGAAGSVAYPTAPFKAAHNYVSMGTAHDANTGNWGTNCVDCHDPHFQAQVDWAGGNPDDLYLVQGTIGGPGTFVANANGTTTFNYALTAGGDPNWATPADWVKKNSTVPGRGLILVDNRATADNTYEVVAADAATITVQGVMTTASATHTFGLTYGQLVKSTIATPHSGLRTVKFFNPKKTVAVGAFTDASTPAQGVCQVCHTLTTHWTQDGGLTAHNSGTPCETCHIAADGFKPNTTLTDHSIANVLDTPLCVTCHAVKDPMGIHNGVCTACHAITPPTLDLPGNKRFVTAISKGDCVHCHTAYFNAHTHSHHPAGTDPTPALSCSSCHGGATSGLSTYHIGQGTVKRGLVNGAGTIGTTIGCATCHSSTVPAVINAINASKGASGTTVICSDCHGTRAANHPADIMPVHSFLTKSATTCMGCHDPAGNADIVSVIHKGACTDCHDPATFALRTGTNGNATLHVLGSSSSCTVCHANRGTNYANHDTVKAASNHAAMVMATSNSTCETCHTGTISPFAATGEAHGRLGCATCHTPTTGVLVGSALTRHTMGVASSCAQCHSDKSNGHTTEHNTPVFDFAAKLEPVALVCANCHGASAVPVISTFHLGLGNVRLGQINGVSTKGTAISCASCHSSAVTAVKNAIAAGRGAAGTPVACSTCHGVRAANHPNDVMPDHSTFLNKSAGNCMGCHDIGGAKNVVTDIHKNLCTDCHDATYALRNGTVGNATLHVVGGTSSCTVCHPNYGTDYKNHILPDHVAKNLVVNMTNSSCETCHNAADTIVVTHKNKCDDCHIAITGALRIGTTGDATLAKTGGNCAACHVSRATDYKNHSAVDHVAKAFVVKTTNSTCETCHSGTDTIATTHKGLCADCHVNITGALRTGATGDAKLAPTGGNCAVCHPSRATNYTNHLAPDHVAKNLVVKTTDGTCEVCHGLTDTIVGTHKNNCAACHTAVTGVLRTGTTGDAKLAPTGGNCKVCHPTRATDFYNHITPDHVAKGFVTATIGATKTTNCAGCHSPTDTINNAVAHAGRCADCHTAVTGLLHIGTSVPVYGDATLAPTGGSCVTCHGTYGYFDSHKHGTGSNHDVLMRATDLSGGTDPVVNACTYCHAVGGTTNTPKFTNDWAGILALHRLGCAECHNSNRTVNIQGPYTSIGNVIGIGTNVGCLNCHSDRAVGHGGHGTPDTVALKADACVICHDNDVNNPKSVVGDIHKGVCTNCHISPPTLRTLPIPGVVVITRGGDCETCHGVGYGHTVSNPTHSKIIFGNDGGTNSSCISCHDANPITEHVTVRGWFCSICHQTPVYNAIIANAIASPTATVFCTDCHVTQTFPHGSHNHNISNQANCVVCHGGTNPINDIHVPGMVAGNGANLTCDTCHTSAVPAIVNAIAAHTATCATCHGARYQHSVVGQHTISTVAPCNTCHTAATVTFDQVVTLHRDTCTTCHGSTDPTVVGVINTGGAVTCTSCHTGTAGTVHHANNHAKVGQCEWCHSTPKFSAWNTATPGDNGGTSQYPTQLGCVKCHVTFSGGTMTVLKFADHSKTDYSTDFVKSTQHQIAGMTASTINSYEMCMSCHYVGSTKVAAASQVKVYHAKPTWTPADTSGNRGNCGTGTGIYAPGRSSSTISKFLIFRADFWPTATRLFSSSGCRTTNYTPNNYTPANNPNGTFMQIVVPNVAQNGNVGSTAGVPVLASVTKQTAADTVKITQAWWTETSAMPGTGRLELMATSTVTPGTGSLTYLGNAFMPVGNHYELTLQNVAMPTTVTVTSAAGGSGLATVSNRTCTTCSSGGVGTVPHPNVTNIPVGDATSGFCSDCHSGKLDAEHKTRGFSCTNCHGNGSGSVYVPTFIQANISAAGYASIIEVVAAGKLNPANVTCVTCHGQPSPLHATHDANTHDVQMQAVDQSSGYACNFCHRKGGTRSANPLFSETWGGTDGIYALHQLGCSECHASTRYNTTVPGTVNPEYGSVVNVIVNHTATIHCLDCHADRAIRHGGHVVTDFAWSGNCANCHTGVDIAKDVHKDKCTSCHVSELGGGALTSLALGHLKTSSCTDCHTDKAASFFNHTVSHIDRVMDEPNCSTCHPAAAGTATTITVNAADKKVHATCGSCHDEVSGALLTTAQANKPGTVASVAYMVPGDCVECHGNYFALHGNITHVARVATTANCSSCHTATAGTAAGVPVSVSDNKVHDGCATCHDVTLGTLLNVAQADLPGTAATVSSMVAGDCNACHGAYFTSHKVASHLTTVAPAASCVTCHTATAGAVPLIPLSQADNKVHDLCTTCHNATNGAILAAYGKASAMPIHGGDCTACHGAYMPLHTHTHLIAHDSLTDLAQAAPGQPCMNCHDDANLGKGTLALSTWAAILTEHKNDCNLCHSSGRAEVTSAISALAATKCLTCHGTKVTPNTHGGHIPTDFAWTPASTATCGASNCHNAAANTNVLNSIHHGSCTLCHSTSNGGDGTTKLGARNNGDARLGDTTSPHVSECVVCHNNGSTIVPGGIHHDTTGAANNNCTQVCHTAVDHSTRVGAATACTTCHSGTAGTIGGIPVSLTDPLIHDACRTCHTFNATSLAGQLVAPTGNRGVTAMPAGGGVCTVCHTAVASTIHHGNAHAAVGECEWCHSTPKFASWNTATPGDNGGTSLYPTQLACKQCHVSFVGGVMTVTKFADHSKTDYSADFTKSTQHTLSGMTASNINTYEICMSCHFIGSTKVAAASQVKVFHAKPTWPASDTSGNRGNCGTSTGVYAPGRASSTVSKFLLFRADFWPTATRLFSSSGCRTTNYTPNNYTPATNPNVSFVQIVVPNVAQNGATGNTIGVPVLQSVTKQTVVSPSADDVKVTSASWNGTNIVAIATTTNSGGCSTMTAVYNTSSQVFSGTTSCTATFATSVVYSSAVPTLNVNTSNPAGMNVTGYRITDSTAPVTETHTIAMGATDLAQGAPGALCSTCHVPAPAGLVTWDSVLALHLSDCTKCHNSVRSDVIAAIAAKANPTRCLTCHSTKQTPATHPAGGGGHTPTDFGWTVATTTSCGAAACHNAAVNTNVVVNIHKGTCTFCHTSMVGGNGTTILGARNNGDARLGDTTSPHLSDCLVCHNNGNTIVVGGIHHDTASAANNDCTVTCHSPTTRPATHATRVAGAAACVSCHTATAGSATGVPVSPTDPQVHDGCRTCHTFNSSNFAGQLVTPTGNRGVTAMPVGGGDCTACHTAVSSTIHHGNAHAAVGECEYCHATPKFASWNTATPGDNGGTSLYPTQLACKQCHVTFVGGVMTVTKFADHSKTNYAADFTKTTQHQIAGMTASNINSYEMCMSCHYVGSTKVAAASQVKVYHAKPTWTPTDTSGNRGNCGTSLGVYAPGRASSTISKFLVFRADFWPTATRLFSSSGCRTTNYTPNNYTPATNPNVSFVQVVVPNVAQNGSVGSTVGVPVLQSITKQTVTTPSADTVKVTLASWNGSSLVVNATTTNAAGCSTLSVTTQPDATARGAMSGTGTCTLTVAVSTLPASINVKTSNTAGFDVIGYRVTDTSTPGVDTTPPTDGVLTVTAGNGQNGLSWTAASDAGGLRATNAYEVRFLTGATAPTCTTGTSVYQGTGQSYTHGSLTNGTQYSYRVCAYDAANNVSAGATGSGTPTAVSDTTPPTQTGTLTATASGSAQIDLSWPAATDAGSGMHATTPYKVVRATGATAPADCTGTAIYSGTALSYSNTGLTASTQYSYRVCAYDAVNNVSAGLTASATTSAASSSLAVGSAFSATNVVEGTGAMTALSGSYTVGAGSNRLLVVVAQFEAASATDTASFTSGTWGGQSLTSLTVNGSGSLRNRIWVGYMKEAQIAAASGTTLNLNIATSASPSAYVVKAAYYTGANQTTPINNFVNGGSDTGASPHTFGTALNVVNGGQALYFETTNSGVTYTQPSGYTELYDGNDPSANYALTAGSKAITANGTENPSITQSAATRYAITGVSIQP